MIRLKCKTLPVATSSIVQLNINSCQTQEKKLGAIPPPWPSFFTRALHPRRLLVVVRFVSPGLSQEKLGINLHCVDAKDRFLTLLDGCTEPEAKRKIIGKTFIHVFQVCCCCCCCCCWCRRRWWWCSPVVDNPAVVVVVVVFVVAAVTAVAHVGTYFVQSRLLFIPQIGTSRPVVISVLKPPEDPANTPANSTHTHTHTHTRTHTHTHTPHTRGGRVPWCQEEVEYLALTPLEEAAKMFGGAGALKEASHLPHQSTGSLPEGTMLCFCLAYRGTFSTIRCLHAIAIYCGWLFALSLATLLALRVHVI